MADTEHPGTDPEDTTPDPGGEVPAEKAEITTVPEMRQWLRNWVGKAVGRSPDDIDESVPMVELGLASRDAVAMAADIEDMTGVTLSVAVAFQHPTIESLATRIIEGEPEVADDDLDRADWTRTGPAERVDIAIVGLSTRLPGDMNSPDETWQALMEGRDAITDLPEGRWSEFLEEPRIAARVAAARTRGGYLKDVKGFDSEFFAVAKTEADNIDPQQRMALELTWEALEHARIPASSLRGEAVGVYVGFSNNDYQFLAVSDPTVAHPYAITGTASSIIANRVSYFYDFRGPSMALDTACSSSLVATHQAVQALRNGECDVAVAGGVNALLTPLVTLGFDEIGAVLAPDGKIKSFSSDADGYTRSEGGGMFVLKRVDDARRDGDQILAVIAGSAVNHDGRSNGLIAPNQDAQAEVLRRAYKDAGIDPRTVDYIEAHGTGTVLGDPIEAEALGRIVGRGRSADRPALLGAVKTNVGHLESAAGAASLAKVVLALQHDKLPPSINFAGPSPYIDFDGMRLKFVDNATDWPRYGGYALAGVSSFGFGGANAHLVVREVLPRDVVEKEAREPAPQADAAEATEAPTLESHSLRFDDFGNIIPDPAEAEEESYELPGVTEEALRLKEIALEELAAQEESAPLIPIAVSAFLTSRKKAAAAELADWMESPEGQASSLESIGRALSRRNHGRSRAVVLAHDHDEAVKGLRAVAEGKQRPNVFSVDGPVTSGPVWAMAGFGAQHRKMGKSLYLRNEVFAEWIEKVDALIQDERGYSVLELILDDSHEYGIETSNVVIFAIQIALGELLKHHGAKPAAVVGQSLGEPASAYFSGGLSLADATRVICSRSHLMGEGEAMLFGEYIRLMALVEYSADELKTVFADYPGLEVCVYAAPSQTVIGGPPEQIDAIVARCEAEGRFARKLQTKGAGHTSQMDPLLGEFSAELQGIEPLTPTVGIFSTVHEGSYVKPGGEPIHDVAYWVKGMRHSVYFTHGVRNAVDSGHTTFLELAPNPVALMQIGLTTAAAGLHDAQLIPTLAKKQDDVESMTSAMAQLYVHGHDLDIRTLFSRARGPQGSEDFANVPPTRFKRKEHWLDVHFSGDGSVIMPGTHVALPDGRHVWEYAPRNGETDLAALVRSAATQVLPDAQLAASEQRAVPGPGARLVTTMTRHPGGASIQVHARIDESFTLVYDALVSRAGQSVAALPTAVGAGATIAAPVTDGPVAEAPAKAPAEEPDAETLSDSLTNRYLPTNVGRWTPDSGETIAERLGLIVSAAMGYEPEDLPWEVPLIELGLDSLMAVRIKNRVEYDFDLPPIQLTAVRDANLYAVEKLIEYAIEHRDEVEQLAEHQKTQTAEEIAREQAQLLSGATPTSGAAPAPDPQAEPETQPETPSSASDAPIPPPPTDPSGPAAATNGGRPNLAGALSSEAVAKALNSDVPPRDAAERVTFATWAIVTGKSPGGIFNPLPKLDEDAAAKMAQRLSERAEGPITAEDVLTSETVEALAEKVRGYLEAGTIDGFVRTIRAPENDSQVPVFVFHPAGGSTVVYEPLLNRLPANTPMYGFERVEGTIQERAAQYVPKLLEMNDGKPFILAGWSLGGALAYACAIGLRRAGADVRFVGMIDTVRAGEEIPQTKEETRKRWDRYAKFAERTFNVEIPAIPYEQLEQLDDEGQVKFVLDIVQQSGVQIPGGIVEHQRTSYLDNRALETVVIEPYDGHVTLYMADRYHDDVIAFEPRYAVRQPDGGWGAFVADLEVVPIGGEHIQAIDEPIIAKVGAHLADVLNKVEAQASQTSEVGK